MTSRNTAVWFVAPAICVIAVFFVLPVLAALALSLTDFDIYALADLANLRVVGLRNYLELLQRPLFWSALGHTVYFVAVGVPLSMAASLGSALLLNSPLARAKPFFRTALFAPVVTTVVAMAVIWRYLFNTKYGMANFVLGHLGIHPIDWLGRWTTAAIPPGERNFAFYSNPAFDQLVAAARVELDGPKRLQQIKDALKILAEDAPIVFSNREQGAVAWNPTKIQSLALTKSFSRVEPWSIVMK